jgi:predicted N-acetyltransferase YhbS
LETVLTTLITREGDRRRGAGGMLVKWGLQRAIKDGVPAFIEASPAGKPLYMACGFSHVGDLHFDLAEFGFAEPVVVAKMAANLGSA